MSELIKLNFEEEGYDTGDGEEDKSFCPISWSNNNLRVLNLSKLPHIMPITTYMKPIQINKKNDADFI